MQHIVWDNGQLPDVAPERLLLRTHYKNPSDPGPEFLETLANLPVRKLTLLRPATAALISAIGRMPALEDLHVSDEWASDARLSHAPRLKWLVASVIPDLPHLAALPALEALTFGNQNDERPFDLSQLSSLVRLKSLRFTGEADGLEPLVALPALEELYLNLGPLNRDKNASKDVRVDLTPITQLTRITKLTLFGIPPCSLAPFAGLSRLSWLTLSWRGLPGADGPPARDAASLGRLAALERLELCGALGRDDALTMLFELEKGQTRPIVILNCGLPAIVQSLKWPAPCARALIGSFLPRVVPAPAAPVDPKVQRKALAPLREAMKAADDPRAIAVALRRLDRASLEAVGAGTGLDPEGKLVFGPYLEKECKTRHRADVALYLLDMLGLLDGVRLLDLEGHRFLMDLGPLERHLGTLEVLSLKRCERLANLSTNGHSHPVEKTFVGVADVRSVVEAALASRSPFDWPAEEADEVLIPPALATLFKTPDPSRLREAVNLAATSGLAARVLADCERDATMPFGVRRKGLLRSKCPDCGGTGHVTRAARARLLDVRVTEETECPTCDGKGEPAAAAEAMTHALLELLATLPAGDLTAAGLVGQLTEVRAHAGTPQQLTWLKHAPRLTTLVAPWALCELALDTLKALPALSRLELSGLYEDLSPIAGLRRLKALSLAGGAVDGRVFAGLDELETLRLDEVAITNPQALADLPHLQAIT